jgi:hypothetical protein
MQNTARRTKITVSADGTGLVSQAAAADTGGTTDAAERFEQLDPVVFDYLAGPQDPGDPAFGEYRQPD